MADNNWSVSFCLNVGCTVVGLGKCYCWHNTAEHATALVKIFRTRYDVKVVLFATNESCNDSAHIYIFLIGQNGNGLLCVTLSNELISNASRLRRFLVYARPQ